MNRIYSFDDHPEHKAQLAAHAQKWIDNALSTAPADRPKMVEAIEGLYAAADLTPPSRIVFVQSPFAAHIADGTSSALTPKPVTK